VGVVVVVKTLLLAVAVAVMAQYLSGLGNHEKLQMLITIEKTNIPDKSGFPWTITWPVEPQ
jgi:hypothetical protein